MNFLVCIKLVPDVANAKIDPETNNLIREGLKMIINPSDLCALRYAIDLKKNLNDGSKITILSMGPRSAEPFLRDCVEMGADEVYLVEGREFVGSDTLATSFALSEAIKHIGNFDIIFTGDRTSDGDTGQVGAEIAEFLNINQISYVKGIEYKDNTFILEKLTTFGDEFVKCKAPFLVTALKDSVKRPSKFAEDRSEIAKNVKINILNVENLKLDMDKIGQKGSPTTVVEVFAPKLLEKGQFIEGNNDEKVDKILEILKRKAFI